MSKIEEAIEDIINVHLSGMDFSDMVTTEVRETWDMDELDRIDDIADAVENLENNLDSATLENMDNRLSLIEEHVNQKLTGLREEYREKLLQYDDELFKLEQRVLKQLNKKSFFQKLVSFFRGE
jgi:hypothetical protein